MQVNRTQCRRPAPSGMPDPPGAAPTQDDSAESLVEQVLQMCKELIDAATRITPQSTDFSPLAAWTPPPPAPRIEWPDSPKQDCGAPQGSCVAQALGAF